MLAKILEPNDKTPIAVIGDGCAALSLAAQASSLPKHTIDIFIPKQNVQTNDHIWGYWDMFWMREVAPVSLKKWHEWIIETSTSKITMQSSQHPYRAVRRSKWLAHCRSNAEQNGVKFHKNLPSIGEVKDAKVFDSRPPKFREGMMIQHFIGWEVEAPAGSFNDETAILMDFRCDQSRGVHFIYCLPFSDSKALIESTIFSPNVEPESFYETAISNWLSDFACVQNFEVVGVEKGAIPLGIMELHDTKINGIGSNCGAIRPSSGYAFSFIQKQISAAIFRTTTGEILKFVTPHKKVDLFMDRVFLSVLRNQPQIAQKIFSSLAARLNGDEFAQFLSGEATVMVRLKVIAAMPVWPFIRALFKLEDIPI
ncbi:lycopene cyclase family protein [Amylibacter sp.]|nr:lycopene cyclase family protein [Amylibacter sp.]